MEFGVGYGAGGARRRAGALWYRRRYDWGAGRVKKKRSGRWLAALATVGGAGGILPRRAGGKEEGGADWGAGGGAREIAKDDGRVEGGRA
jgi:hypothetical protein